MYWFQGILTLILVAAGELLRRYLRSYVDTKARNLTTKEDFQQVLDQTRKLGAEPVICCAGSLREFGVSVVPRGHCSAGRLVDYKNLASLVGKGWMAADLDRLILDHCVATIPSILFIWDL